MPSSDTVKRVRQFSRSSTFRDEIIPSLIDVPVGDSASINKVAGAETRSEKKLLANQVSLARDIYEPLNEYIARTNNKTCNIAEELLGRVETDTRDIGPLRAAFDTIEFDVSHAIPCGGSIIHKKQSYQARLSILNAVALRSDIIGSEPVCSYTANASAPDFESWHSLLRQRFSGKSAEAKERKVYWLISQSQPSDDSTFVTETYPSVEPFARYEDFGRPPEYEDFLRFWHGPLNDIPPAVEESLSKYAYTSDLYSHRLWVLGEGLSLEQVQRSNTVHSRSPYAPRPRELSAGLSSIASEAAGSISPSLLGQILSSSDFLHSFNAYLFMADIYFHKVNTDEITNFRERPRHYPTVPENRNLNICRSNIYDSYPTKVFTFTDARGRHCAIAFAGGLNADELSTLHTLLLTVDRCEYYELW